MNTTANIALKLTPERRAAFAADAAKHKLDESSHATRIIEKYMLGEEGLLGADDKRDIPLEHRLIDQAADKAEDLWAKGAPASVTYNAIEAVAADPTWIAEYEVLVRDNPYKHGNPRKQTINQNLGYYIKKRLRAKSVTKPDGKPVNVKVNSSIIQSYTPLKP